MPSKEIKKDRVLTALEFFAGSGGLTLGVHNAGFKHLALVERDKSAAKTLRQNSRAILGMDPRLVKEEDAARVDLTPFIGEVDLMTAGPPCQPFSLGGKCRGPEDERDMFPQAVRAVRELMPLAFIFENVKGLLRPAFATYLDYLRLQLMYPEITAHPTDKWLDHLSRLERHYVSGGDDNYRIVIRPVNAADYGVPQHRERVIIIGFRTDLEVEWSFPEPTHSEDALLRDQWVTGKYWDQHEVSKRNRTKPPAKLQGKINELKDTQPETRLKPWVTVRDAISDLPDPEKARLAGSIPNHVFVPGARSYPGHTGSPLDEPAKALKAGDHGVPGGENMLMKPNGQVRYFTTRECARLQGFPDEYVFEGAWVALTRQLGNAVPVQLSESVASNVKNQLAATVK